MPLIDSFVFVTSILLLLGIVSSKFSARLGMPVLVLFLALGMLAGSEGIGGIDFEDYKITYAIGTVALAIILFDGGLSTSMKTLQQSWLPAGSLATIGVLITAVITGLAAAWILHLPILQGLLLGSIVGSTDAAAVFSVLRAGGVHIRPRLANTLEIESGANDPMAIFLTIGLLEVVTGKMSLGFELLGLFVSQMGIGLAAGLLTGWAAVGITRKINLASSALYPILASAFGMLSFGLAAICGGSGFLSVYLTGIVIGNHRLVQLRNVIPFHNAVAWLAQIVMFIVLGLLSFPSRLLAVVTPGLAIAAILIFVSRPVAVLLSVWWGKFTGKELVFLSWVGLKGAMPITLATFPLMAGIAEADEIFDVVFFVVLVSAVLQGWSLPWIARRLGVAIPLRPKPPVTLELSSLQEVEGDIVDYFVDRDCRASGKLIRDLALPENVVVALIVHEQQIKLPQGSTRIEPGDHVIVVLRPSVRKLVDRLFCRSTDVATDSSQEFLVEFPIRATVTIQEFEQLYDLHLSGPAEMTLAQWIKQRLAPTKPSLGKFVIHDLVSLRITQLTEDGEISQIAICFIPID